MITKGRREVWRRHWQVLVSLALATAAEGAFLRNVPQRVTQPDGTVLHLYATGDEYYNRLHDAAGFTIVRDPRTGFLVYAVRLEGRLQPSGLIVGKDDPTVAGLEKDAMPDARYLPAPEEIYPTFGRPPRLRARGLANAPEFSEVNNLVIFIRFADETGGFQTLASYQMWFTSTDPAQASMRRYFLEASYGALDVSSTFYPPPDGSVMMSFQDSHPRAYYEPYDATTNPDGYTTDQRAAREWALLQAAATSIATQVPPSPNLDSNNDGFVDNVIFVVSGGVVNADWGNLLWPHRWVLDYVHYPATINGKLVGAYNLQLDQNIEVGVLCHELTHTLGAPDLYHYSDCSAATDLEPVGPWDLMAATGTQPQHSGAYVKWRYLGFLSSIPLLTPPATVTLSPLTSASNNAFRIASPNAADEYFVVEYRRRSFPFENSLPGSGLLVYRIDTAADGHGDRCGPPDEVYVYRPGGTPTANGNPRAAFLTSDAVPPRTSINDTTNPSAFLSDGFPGGLAIHDIGPAGDTITFTVDAVSACSKPGPFSLTAPLNGASVPPKPAVTLSWRSSDGGTSYDVFFGTEQEPPLLGNQTGTSVAVAVADDTTYFWRVAAKNACGQTFAPAAEPWAFSVGSSPGITLLSEDFEGDLSKWSLGRSSGAGPTGWGTVGCKASSGQGAIWCAGGGTAPQPACTLYASNQGTFLVAGPFSLEDASDGTWDFDIWYDVDDGGNPEDPPDGVYWMWSLDGRSYYGYGSAGTSAGWEHRSLSLADLKMDDDTPIVGQSQVYFAFLFLSDGATQREGAYIDNVLIKKVIGQTGLPPRVRRHLGRR